MTALEKLWNNDIRPSERYFRKNGDYANLLDLAIKQQNTLNDALPKEGRELLDDMCNTINTMHAIEESDAFVRGFRLGVQILLDAIGKYDGEFGA